MKKVFLDAGHGGKDPGGSGNGLVEKDIALSVTLKIGEILERHNVSVVYSRTTDTFIELSNRSNRANVVNADIFVSIHTNAFTSPSAQGVETYHYPSSTNGNRLATSIHDSIVKGKFHTKNRGVKSANFAVLRQTRMASALVELAFITNKEDASILSDRQDGLAESIAKGILSYVNVMYQEIKTKPSKEQIEGRKTVRIKKDDKIIEVEGYMEEGTNYVQAREVFEKLGCKVSWDKENRIIIVE